MNKDTTSNLMLKSRRIDKFNVVKNGLLKTFLTKFLNCLILSNQSFKLPLKAWVLKGNDSLTLGEHYLVYEHLLN